MKGLKLSFIHSTLLTLQFSPTPPPLSLSLSLSLTFLLSCYSHLLIQFFPFIIFLVVAIDLSCSIVLVGLQYFGQESRRGEDCVWRQQSNHRFHPPTRHEMGPTSNGELVSHSNMSPARNKVAERPHCYTFTTSEKHSSQGNGKFFTKVLTLHWQIQGGEG